MKSPAPADPPIDSVAVRLMWDRLVSIVDEATVTQYRTAFSTVVQEANDFACSVMDRRGGTLANSRFGLPSFVATQAVTLRTLLTRFDAGEIREGDVFITNDPWIATGQVMDLTLLRPIFRNGRLVAFAGSVAHAPDLGGVQRWNTSTDVFEEAIFIPLMKLHDGGSPNRTLLDLIAANTRIPDLTIGDLEAQLAAMRPITSRLVSLMDEYGLESLDPLADDIYTRSEAAMRSAIAAIPDGTYTGEVLSDGFPDPLDLAKPRDPILIRATVVVAGDEMHVGFAGSSTQQPGSFNSIWTFSEAYTLYGLRLILVPDLPNNAGFYRPISVDCPGGSVVNARFPAATLSRHAVGHQVVDAVYAALAPVLPGAVIAQGGSAPSWDLILMGNDRRGRPFNRLVIINGGSGARATGDGHTWCFPANISNTPVEILETSVPVLCEEKAVIVDSAGPGRHRGGFGQRISLRARNSFGFSLINARVVHPPQGLLGGQPGRRGRALLDGLEIPPGTDGEVPAGHQLVIETPGGGGMGPMLERDSTRTAIEMADGLVTSSWGSSVHAEPNPWSVTKPPADDTSVAFRRG
jgi:N-methylhydantoinase B